MSLSVIQQPSIFTPAYNDVVFVVQSTDYASAGFQFMGVVKNSGGTTIHNLKAKIYLDSTNKGVFNLKRILESYVEHDFHLLRVAPYDELGYLTGRQSSIFEFEFEMGQEGGDPVVEHPNLQSITGFVFNGALSRRDFASYASGNFVVKAGNTGYFLTDQTKIIRQNQYDWLYYIEYAAIAQAVNRTVYKSYNNSGLLKTVEVATTAGTLNTYTYGRVPSGRNTNLINPSDITSGTLPVIHPSATYYTIELLKVSGATCSEVYTVTLDDECNQYNQYNIWYLNKQGGFDSFMFDLKSFDKVGVERSQYKRSNYELSSTYAYNNDKAAVVNYDLRYGQKLTLHSDWLNDAQASDLEVLIDSPVIFMQKYGDTFYTPINIDNNEWEKSLDVNNPLRVCKLEIVVADNNRRQHG